MESRNFLPRAFMQAFYYSILLLSVAMVDFMQVVQAPHIDLRTDEL